MFVHPQFDPVAVSLGPLAVRWYGLMYVAGFIAYIVLGKYRARNGPALGMEPRDVDDLLIYGTGGLAFADVAMRTTVAVGDPPMGTLRGAHEQTKVGWTLGGGAEYAVTDCVTLKAEALYFDLGSIALNAATPEFTDASLDVRQRVAGTIARAGISYRF